jgi:hypothetical protein
MMNDRLASLVGAGPCACPKRAHPEDAPASPPIKTKLKGTVKQLARMGERRMGSVVKKRRKKIRKHKKRKMLRKLRHKKK